MSLISHGFPPFSLFSNMLHPSHLLLCPPNFSAGKMFCFGTLSYTRSVFALRTTGCPLLTQVSSPTSSTPKDGNYSKATGDIP